MNCLDLQVVFILILSVCVCVWRCLARSAFDLRFILDGTRDCIGHWSGTQAHRRGPVVEKQSPNVNHIYLLQHNLMVSPTGFLLSSSKIAVGLDWTRYFVFVSCFLNFDKRLLYSFNIRTFCTISCILLAFHLLDTYRNNIRRKKMTSPSRCKLSCIERI